VPVHQPPDREDDKDQPDYAADPNGSALTVIAAAVEPKPAPKEKHEQHDYQKQFHRFVFLQICRQSVPSGGWQLSTRADRAGCGAATESRSRRVEFIGRVASIDLQ
jgi:hypothetical protein